MSGPSLSGVSTADLLAALETRLADHGSEAADVPDEAFASAFAAMVRHLAARAQAGSAPPLTSGNSGISATDGVIACTALLETVGVEVFELSAWQALTDVGSRRRSGPDHATGGKR